MTMNYELRTEFNSGFGWQFTIYKDGQLAIRRGTYETEEQARRGGLSLMAHRDAPRKFTAAFLCADDEE